MIVPLEFERLVARRKPFHLLPLPSSSSGQSNRRSPNASGRTRSSTARSGKPSRTKVPAHLNRGRSSGLPQQRRAGRGGGRRRRRSVGETPLPIGTLRGRRKRTTVREETVGRFGSLRTALVHRSASVPVGVPVGSRRCEQLLLVLLLLLERDV